MLEFFAQLPQCLIGIEAFAGAGTFVLVVLLGQGCGLDGQGAPRLAQQLLTFFVHADHRLARIGG